MATLLGFIDDLFDIRWRHKLPIPLIASIPLLLVYYAERGNTHIVVPRPFRSIFGTIVDLGVFDCPRHWHAYVFTRPRARPTILFLYVLVVDVFDQ
jgi:UDP-N-acetylmuramyl pentapeptide phosphotransferase/UDP-N-acetylglucosamine-1-phosphate transferase